jgi:tRNA dimethylallyltransferase
MQLMAKKGQIAASGEKIIVILGPTASGKSNLAIEIARKLNGEIISADSRQVYQGMDIGSGKITKKEQRMAKHWMLDIVSPKTEYNVAKFKKSAIIIIDDILKRGKIPIICGGTGFWIRSIVDNMSFPEVKPDWQLRDKLRRKSLNRLFNILKKSDPERAKNIDPHNKVRLIRAIEICNSIGTVPKLKESAVHDKYEFLQIGICFPRNILYARIKQRLDARFRQGMIAEVKNLHYKKGVSWKRLERFGLEYRWIARFLQGKISRKELESGLYQDICNYSKRQMTWFKKDKRIIWIQKNKSAESLARKFLGIK